MRILILGHKGMLGSDLVLRLVPHHEVEGRDAEDFDIASSGDCRRVISQTGPDLVINAAAYTDVDGCEKDKDRCFSVNALGVKNIAAACRGGGIKIVHFSTDYVFDGRKGAPYREDDPCHPLNTYGKSKLAGEVFLRELAPPFILVRTEWLYGKRGKNFVRTILEKAGAQNTLEVVDDQIGAPTFTWDLAGAVQVLIEGGHEGIFHITNRGSCSWYEFALKILQYSGLNDVTILPIDSERLARPALRPAYSVLSCRKFVEATGKAMRYWQIALQDYLEHEDYQR